MALPNFRFYYWAANICCVIFWSYFYNRADCPLWVAMELSCAKSFSIPALLGSSLPLPSNKLIDNPVVWHTLRVWAQFRRNFGFTDLCLSSPISANHLFQPSLLDLTFLDWRRLGIECFRDLFTDTGFVSFEQLAVKFSLPKSHFYRYLQIRHFLRGQLPSFPQTPDASTVDVLLNFKPCKGLVSTVYNKLLGIRQAPLNNIRTA